MTELAAAVAREQLKKLHGVVDDRRKTAERLTAALNGLPGLTAGVHAGATYWRYPIFVDGAVAGAGAVRYAEVLAAEGVPVIAGYIQSPLYLTPVLADHRTYGESGYPLTSPPAESAQRYEPGLCPVTEQLIEERLLVVDWNENYTDDDVADIIAAVHKAHAALAPAL